MPGEGPLDRFAPTEALLLPLIIVPPLAILCGLHAYLPPMAAFLTAFGAYLAPGLALALLCRRRGSAVEALAVAPAVNFGLVGLLALAAYAGRWTPDALGAVVLALGIGLGAVALAAVVHRGLDDRYPGAGAAATFFALVLLVEVFLLLYRSPMLRPDNYTYLAYLRDFLDRNRFGWEEPLFQSGAMVKSRMLFSFWLAGEVLVTRWSGIDLYTLHRAYLSLPLLVFVPLVTFALGREIFPSRAWAWCGSAVQAAFFTLSEAGRDSLARLPLRIREDKVLASLVVFPALAALMLSCLRRGSRGDRVLLLAGSVGLAFTHPTIAAFFALAAGLFLLVTLLVDRSRTTLSRAVPVAVAVAVMLLFPLVQRLLYFETSARPGGFTPFSLSDPHAYARQLNQARLLILDGAGRFFMLHPRFLAGLTTAGALLAGVVLLPRIRRDPGARYLAVTLYGFTILAFIPGVSLALGSLVTPSQLWRVLWVMPFPLVLTAAAWFLAGTRGRERSPGPEMVIALGIAAVVIGLLLPALRPFPSKPQPWEALRSSDLWFYRRAAEMIPGGSLVMTRRPKPYLPVFTGRARVVCFKGEVSSRVVAGEDACAARREYFDLGTGTRERLLILARYRPDYLIDTIDRESAVWAEKAADIFTCILDAPRRLLFRIDHDALDERLAGLESASPVPAAAAGRGK